MKNYVNRESKKRKTQLLAAFTIASTFSRVMSPLIRLILSFSSALGFTVSEPSDVDDGNGDGCRWPSLYKSERDGMESFRSVVGFGC